VFTLAAALSFVLLLVALFAPNERLKGLLASHWIEQLEVVLKRAQ
jgi:hypothetical protein